ncbi:MAG: hypothetical protein CSA68_06335 [Rhodobacterales bacterium]|nr:MAG: hypothetical protein CSA68_06335 [Rhodobacterales bacterium]
MFADFLKNLIAPDPDPLAEMDARLAFGALLVRVAKSDEHYDDLEAVRIEQLLGRRYGLNSAEAGQLRHQCEALEFEAPDTVRFTRAIKDCTALEDRIGVMEDLWSVVLADGVRDAGENALLRLLANLLGISDVQSAQARQTAQSQQ